MSVGGAIAARTQADPGALPHTPLTELVGLDLSVVVEDEDADRVEFDVVVCPVPILECSDRIVGGDLIWEHRNDDSLACHMAYLPRDPAT